MPQVVERLLYGMRGTFLHMTWFQRQTDWCYIQHVRLIPMYNARFILWPPSLSSPILIWEENDDGHVE